MIPLPKPRRFQYIPKPQPMRLPARNAVTIGVGFRCRDGIVLCSDTQLTKYDIKFPGNKIHLITPNQVWEGGEWIIATAYAGTEPIARNVLEGLAGRLLPKQNQPDVPTIRKAIEESLDEERYKNKRELDRLEMLFAFSVNNSLNNPDNDGD